MPENAPAPAPSPDLRRDAEADRWCDKNAHSDREARRLKMAFLAGADSATSRELREAATQSLSVGESMLEAMPAELQQAWAKRWGPVFDRLNAAIARAMGK